MNYTRKVLDGNLSGATRRGSVMWIRMATSTSWPPAIWPIRLSGTRTTATGLHPAQCRCQVQRRAPIVLGDVDGDKG